MKNAIAYYVLCRVWNHLLSNCDFDSLDLVSSLKGLVIEEGVPSELLHLAGSIFRISVGLELMEGRQ